jgi:hypothetical protein
MKPLNYIAQEHEHGCGVAVVAMLTRRTFEQAADLLHFSGLALQPWEIENALMRDGWFMRKAQLPQDVGQAAWPPKPFAEVHYAMVTSPPGSGHAVVMLENGGVLDPFDETRHSLAVYYAVHHVIGLRR